MTLVLGLMVGLEIRPSTFRQLIFVEDIEGVISPPGELMSRIYGWPSRAIVTNKEIVKRDAKTDRLIPGWVGVGNGAIYPAQLATDGVIAIGIIVLVGILGFVVERLVAVVAKNTSAQKMPDKEETEKKDGK